MSENYIVILRLKKLAMLSSMLFLEMLKVDDIILSFHKYTITVCKLSYF